MSTVRNFSGTATATVAEVTFSGNAHGGIPRAAKELRIVNVDGSDDDLMVSIDGEASWKTIVPGDEWKLTAPGGSRIRNARGSFHVKKADGQGNASYEGHVVLRD